jgi:hypothetical protein
MVCRGQPQIVEEIDMKLQQISRPGWLLKISMTVILAILAQPVVAKAPYILNIENSPITSTQQLSTADVERSIIEGGRVRGWRMSVIAPGHIEAVIYVRTHVARVDILFGTTSYSITYKGSENLDYKDGRIHRNYNKWIRNLDSDIQAAIPP